MHWSIGICSGDLPLNVCWWMVTDRMLFETAKTSRSACTGFRSCLVGTSWVRALDPESQLSVSSPGIRSSKKCHPGNSTQSRRAENAVDSAVLADKDLLVRLDAFVKLASFELDEGIRKTASLLMQNPQNSMMNGYDCLCRRWVQAT